MKRIVIALAMSLCVVSVAPLASADTLTLKDGTRVSGTVVAIAERMITFTDAAGISHRYSANQVDRLEFSTSTPRSPIVRGAVCRLETLPSGTALAVRTVEDIDSTTAVADQTFGGVVERDILGESGRVVVPHGSHVVLLVREVSSGGATGSPEMVLDIQSLTVAGQRYLVSTADLTKDTGTGLGKNRRTAETVGGGAALGTIIGAIAGGAKGAAIGVLVGAAGGAGVEVLNKGKDVRVPAETLLSFRLDKPVSLQAER
jgi:hypothetical protein